MGYSSGASTSIAAHCAELGLESLSDARQLLRESDWGETPVSAQPQRTLWLSQKPPAPGGGDSPCPQPTVLSVRCTGEVSGLGVSDAAAVLQDQAFHAWRSEDRELKQVIVEGELSLVQETVLDNVPNLQRREFLYLCMHAEQPDGGMLIIERSVDNPTQSNKGGAVTGWRFLAVSVTPIEPAAHGEPSVQINLVLQVDLGNLPGLFTSEFALERADLVNALNQYTERPVWPQERARLRAEGISPPPPPPRSPQLPCSPKAHPTRPAAPIHAAGAEASVGKAHAPSAARRVDVSAPAAGALDHSFGSDRSNNRSSGGSESAGYEYSASEGGDTDDPAGGGALGSQEPTKAAEADDVCNNVILSTDSALHRAQVLAFARLRTTPGAS